MAHIELDKAVNIVLAKSGLRVASDLAEAAAAQHHLHARLTGARRRDKVDRTAEHGGAKPVRRIAAIDFDGFRLSRIGEAHDVGSVRAIDRKSVLQHQYAAFDGVLLQAGAAYLNTRLVVATKEILDHNTRYATQRLGHGEIGAFRNILLRHQGYTAGHCIEALPYGCRGLPGRTNRLRPDAGANGTDCVDGLDGLDARRGDAGDRR